jgi:hypothetical protein
MTYAFILFIGIAVGVLPFTYFLANLTVNTISVQQFLLLFLLLISGVWSALMALSHIALRNRFIVFRTRRKVTHR